MDEVLEKLETTQINPEEKDENKSPFESLYKNWGKLNNQEERRKEILDVQKSNRNQKLDRLRGILDLVNAIEENGEFRFKNKSHYRPSIYVAGFHKAPPSYNNVLMMSEWMIEKPEDFNDNWYITPCPKGVRMLVVASQGRTKCYSKFGSFRFECRTALPGGNPCDPRQRNRCCVLDCFFKEQLNTMFVLDLLAWNSQPMTDGETEFRHYWLQSQLLDIPDLKVINKKNKIIFSLLPKVPCTPESLNKFMMTCPLFEGNLTSLDGLLFYHKRAHYVSGETPLVGWLFPFMVPEVLGSEVTVNEAYLLEKPADYVNQADFILKFEAKQAKKSRGRSRLSSTSSLMDTAEVSKNQNQTEQCETKSKDEKNTKSSESMEAGANGERNNGKMDSEHIKESQEKVID